MIMNGEKVWTWQEVDSQSYLLNLVAQTKDSISGCFR